MRLPEQPPKTVPTIRAHAIPTQVYDHLSKSGFGKHIFHSRFMPAECRAVIQFVQDMIDAGIIGHAEITTKEQDAYNAGFIAGKIGRIHGR